LQKKLGTDSTGFLALQPLLHLLPFLAAVRADRAVPRGDVSALAAHGWPADDPSPEEFLRRRLEQVNADPARGIEFKPALGQPRICPVMPEVAWNASAFRLSLPKHAIFSPLRHLAYRVGSQVVKVVNRLRSAPLHVNAGQVIVVGGPCGNPVFRDSVRAKIERGCNTARTLSAGPAAVSAAAPLATPDAAGGGVTVRVPSEGSIYVAAGAALYLALGNTDARLQWWVGIRCVAGGREAGGAANP
jgi:hypothetical protein